MFIITFVAPSIFAPQSMEVRASSPAEARAHFASVARSVKANWKIIAVTPI